MKENVQETIVFGYFYVENDGIENVLLEINSDGTWKFPVYMQGNFSSQGNDFIVDKAITDCVKATGILGKQDLIDSLYYPPTFCSLKIYRNEDIIPAFFVKVRLAKQIPITKENYRWTDKKIIFKDRGRCLNLELLDSIERDFITNRFDFNILECIDALVFRMKQGKPEFLMIKRRKLYNVNQSGWEYPKGGIHYHETPLEASLRELEEETSSRSYKYKGYLGYQVADVSERKRKYDIVKVHGLTFLFDGNDDEIVPTEEDFDETPEWMPLADAQKMVWMRSYGPEFFKRWKTNKREILGT